MCLRLLLSSAIVLLATYTACFAQQPASEYPDQLYLLPALTGIELIVEEAVSSNVQKNGDRFSLPGKHEYTVHSEAKDILTLEVDAGETYYIVGGITIGVRAGRPNLSPSDAATFDSRKAELKNVTGQGLDKD